MVDQLRDQLRETEVVHRRLIVIMAIALGLIAILIARLSYLQLNQYEAFTDLAQQNRVNTHPVGPVRGLIYDRNGELLAENVRQYRIMVQPNQVKEMSGLLADMRERIELDEGQEARFLKKVSQRPRFEKQILKSGLSEDAAARFSVVQHRYPGVTLEAILKRDYPEGALTGHVLGYVGRINQKDKARIDAKSYGGTQYIGKLGVEASYEEVLLGTVGSEDIETNAHGRKLRALKREVPQSGHNLYLSLDLALQRHAQGLLKDYEGAVVALDPRNGEVLAFVSEPGYDTNPFVDGISNTAYQALRQSERKPLFNRALNGRYAPGSTIKGFVGLVGSQHGLSFSRSVSCPGWFSLPNSRHRYRCWKHSGHGSMDLNDAIAQSCDVYFYDLARKLGIDNLSAGMREFGFGLKTNIDVPHEPDALMPTQDWKKRVHGRSWYPGETVITGIGQGYMLATPLQLAAATAMLANRGQPVQPHFVTAVQDADSGEVTETQLPELAPVENIETRAYDHVISAMRDVVHGARGTARQQGVGLPFEMAGKTGTAQVRSIAQGARYDEANTEKKYRDHSLFVGFAPLDEPRIAVAVVIEHGGSGSKVAAPIARQVMEYYLVDRMKLFVREEVAHAG